MSDYGNYSSDDDSDDDIGLPKTPGAPLNANRSDSEKEDDDNHNDDERSNHSNDNRANSDSSSDSYQSDNDDDDDDEVNRSDGPNNINDDSSDKKSVSSHNGSDAQKSSDESSSNGDSDDEANIQSRKDNNDDENDRHSNASSNQSRKHQDSSSDESNQENKDKFGKKRKTMIDSSSSDDDGDEDENKSREGESETKKAKPSTEEDLFGELSDEDDDDNDRDAEHRTKEKPTINDDNDDEDDINREIVDANMNEIFGGGGDDDDDERMDEEQEAPIPETRIEVEIPRITADLGESIHFVKLPNFLSIDTHPYDPQWYEDEIDEDEVHDDEGRARLKLKVENTIRWRNVDGDPNLRESNARIVKWSDGSMSLHLGDEIFDIQKFNLLPGENNHLYIRQGTGLQGQSVFKTKLTFRPFSTESVTHRKLTMSLADRSQKTQKICVLPTVGKDPEAHRSEMIKKEEIKLKAMIRKEIKAKRIKDRAYTRGVSSSFIEFDDEDDENISISKIKNQYKRGSNPQYSDDDYDNESVDKNKDNDDDDDDSDLDIFDKKKTAERRKILVDSDEDDD